MAIHERLNPLRLLAKSGQEKENPKLESETEVLPVELPFEGRLAQEALTKIVNIDHILDDFIRATPGWDDAKKTLLFNNPETSMSWDAPTHSEYVSGYKIAVPFTVDLSTSRKISNLLRVEKIPGEISLTIRYYAGLLQQRVLTLEYVVSVVDQGRIDPYFRRQKNTEPIFVKNDPSRIENRMLVAVPWNRANFSEQIHHQISDFLLQVASSWEEDVTKLPAEIETVRQQIKRQGE